MSTKITFDFRPEYIKKYDNIHLTEEELVKKREECRQMWDTIQSVCESVADADTISEIREHVDRLNRLEKVNVMDAISDAVIRKLEQMQEELDDEITAIGFALRTKSIENKEPEEVIAAQG